MAECPAVGCPTQAKPGMFMCWNHWRRLPKVIRDEVFRAWRARELVAHAEVCDEAIRLTAEREGQTPPTEAEKRAPRMRKLMDR
ncbi:hypothetical protein UFOVP1324_31 [uncultured Caudovirales phage]|uniref:Uncharacterized protein n=1 Tax=uncultured Caudovirales phage TaxID=2100421 RepID=A0A6J5S1L8_9CAUD|nr:hypothetical protein UFOVP1324_31 [uncultured Caudovirales phage]